MSPVRPAGAESGTRVEHIYCTLKAAVLTGIFQPGDRANLNELSEAFDASLTVVREAMTRLASERLVSSTPQRGFRVASLSIPHLLDLTRVRIEVESLTIRESVEHGDLLWESELVAAHHRLAAVNANLGSFPLPWCMQVHREFHAAVSAACTSPLLKQLRAELFESSELYRHWARATDQQRTREVADEHRELLDAALAHDADKAVETAVAHMRRTTEALVDWHGQRSAEDRPRLDRVERIEQLRALESLGETAAGEQPVERL